MLKQKIPELLEYIGGSWEVLDYNKTIFEILEGDLLTKCTEALRGQTVSDRAFLQAKDRIPPINLIKRLTEKLTQLYAGDVTRTAKLPQYQAVVDYYEEQFDLNEKFNQANLFYNSSKIGMLEPFIKKEEAQLRVLPPHRGLMYSDDKTDDTEPTIFIKPMGTYSKSIFDEKGNQLDICRDAQYYFAYSDSEFIAFDEDGEELKEFMENNLGVNPFECLPVTYINKSDYLLVPIPDKDLLAIQILVVLLLTDMAFGIKYQAHSVLWTKNAFIENLDLNPDSYINLQSSDGEKDPEIGTVKPEIDIEATIQFITTLLDLWLESKNLKAGSAGSIAADMDISGIALMIKELDTTLDVKRQMKKFEKGESAFWDMMIKVHNYWVELGIVQGLPMLPDDFKVSVEYTLPEPIIDESKEVDLVLKQLNKTMTLEIALKRLYPQKNEDEIKRLIEELEKVFTMPLQDEEEDKDAEEHISDKDKVT